MAHGRHCARRRVADLATMAAHANIPARTQMIRTAAVWRYMVYALNAESVDDGVEHQADPGDGGR